MKLFIAGLLILPHLMFAQSQEDFENKYTSVFINLQDSLKAREVAMEAYGMVENAEALQTLSNYYMLKAIFDTIKDEELAEVCEKKANAQLVFNTEVEKPSSYDNPTLEWAYEYQMEFYKSEDPDLGKKALKFLKQHLELVNFTNYSAVAYFFERNMDFEKAERYYSLAFEHIDYDNEEFVSLIQPAFFYMKAGQYEKVEDCLQLNRELLQSANQYTRLGYESSRDMIQMYYYLFIGDYHKYIQSAAAYYDQQYEQNKDNLIGNPYASVSKLNRAIGYEFLRKYDEAEQHYRESQLASEEWLLTMKETYPNYEQASFPLLDVYLAKRGDLTDRESSIAELDEYYQYIQQYSVPTLGQQFQKAIQYALYKDSRYPDLFEEVIKQVSNVRDFNESTLPYSQYAYFLMRDSNQTKAERTYDKLFNQNLEWINDLIFTFGEKAFVAYFTTKLREGYQNYHSFVRLTADDNQSLHQRLAGKAYNNLLLTKSIAFKGIRKRKKAFEKANSPEVIALYDDWQRKKQELIRMYQMAQQDNKDLAASLHVVQDTSVTNIVSKDQLEALQREIDLLENRLASSSSGFEATLKINQPKWQSVRASLKPGEAAMEMIRFHWRDQIYYSDTAYYAAYIIRHDSDSPEVAYLPSLADQLDTRYYNAYRNSIKLKIAETLAESNDGILTAYEAQNLDLEGTELVVLSACETGLGDFDAGEGVYGLQRAFRAAGSKSIVTSLWKVDDQGTRDFMITFYQQMTALKDKRAAFRAAQLAMKAKYKDPYYWGAFVITGN